MLEINPPLLISQTVTFAVMAGVVWKLSWKPLLKFIKDRQDSIRQSIENAEQMRLAASQLEQDYQQRLLQVEQQTKDLIALAKLEGNRAKDEVLATTQKEIAEMKKRAQEHLDLERDQIVRELRDKVISLSMELTTKIVESTSLEGVSEQRFKAMLDELEKKEPARAN
jgi:F-type H+-transporting ATPase subunit b